MPASIIVGFIVDTLTLNRADQVFDNVILLTYIILASFSILSMYTDVGYVRSRWYARIAPFVPIIFLYAIGGLFSGLVVLYSKSGSLIASFPFMIVLIVLFLGNEFFYKKYPRLMFQAIIFYIALFSYCILITPVLLRMIGIGPFMLGTGISLLLMFGFIKLLEQFARDDFQSYKKKLKLSIICVSSVFAFLYVTNIIPPIPLSLKDISVHHLVSKQTDGSYITIDETTPWYARDWIGETIHITPGEPVYVFSSIFAPTRLNTTVSHQWAYFDENTNRWINRASIPIKITGGRDQGYRGYSYSSNVFPGAWRVDVRTDEGKLIGRVRFSIKPTVTEYERVRNIK